MVELRKRRSTWGPKKLRAVLQVEQPEVNWPSASTIGALLKRKGLVAVRRRRLRTLWDGCEVEGAKFPNDVWAMDFKGHFALRNGQRCHPLTVSDLYSRFLLRCEGLSEEKWPLVQHHLELAFREYGMPLRIRSDNGGPFSSLAPGGLCRLAVWLIQLGVTPERIRPRSPQENGSHERMHKTLKAEATRPPQTDVQSQQRVLDDFRARFNQERPHEALGQRTPASLYTRASREFPSQLKQPEYPAGFLVRKTSASGTFHFKGVSFRPSKTLTLSIVGLKQVNDAQWELFYGPLFLGLIDAENKPTLLRIRRKEEGAASADASAAPCAA